MSCVQQVERPSWDIVIRLWQTWVVQHCGRVIATSVEALNPLGTVADGPDKRQCGPPYTCATFDQATDVALLPLGSYAALTAAIMFAKGQLPLEEARAAALAGALPRSTSCPVSPRPSTLPHSP